MLKKLFLSLLIAAASGIGASEPLFWESGKRKAEINGNVFKFSASERDASALRLRNRRFDLSQGLRIELEFRDDAEQVCEYPRLVAVGNFSLQLKVTNNAPDREFKAFLIGPERGTYIQIIVPAKYPWENWHHEACTLEPRNNIMTLQFDRGKVLRHKLPFDLSPAKAELFLGAGGLDRSNRGYNGLIRNVSITSPYTPEPSGDAGAAVPGETTPVVNGEAVRFHTVAAIPGRHLAFPGIAKLPDGRLAVVFREGAEHVCPYGRICMTLSRDGGRNWSAPFSIWDTESDERDPSIHTLPDGRILVTHMAWKSWMRSPQTIAKYPGPAAYAGNGKGFPWNYSQYMFSSDNGRTWTRKVVNAFSPHGPAYKEGFFYQPAIRRSRGKRQIYMYRINADASKVERLGLILETSDGDNRIVPACEEPHTAVLPDGTLLTAVRFDCDGLMRLSRSSDDGKTWSAPVTTPVKGFPQHLLVLRDGRLLATYGYRYYPYGIRACISRDGGKTWDTAKEMILRDNGLNGDLGYPVSIELEDGRVMTVYYHITREHPYCFIEAAVYRP